MPSVLRQLRSLPLTLGAIAALALPGAEALIAEEKVRILFIPPPMEGTLSLGIYNSEGALVRTLHQEAGTDEFHAAFNGLITHWDGKDDSGTPCPPGRYRAKGYMVGDLKVEGITYHGNDWYLDDDSPRLRKITRIAGQPENRLLIEALQPGSDTPRLFIASHAPEADKSGENEDDTQTWKAVPAPEGTSFPEQELFQKPDSVAFQSVKEVSEPGDHTWAPDGLLWGIDGKVVKEYRANGEVERELFSIDETLAPTKITATAPLLFVLGESPAEQRLRGLPYDSPGEALVDNGIVFTDTFEKAQPLLAFPDDSAFTPAEQIKVRLIKNPLLKGEKAGSLKLKVLATPEGTRLITPDGLPLQQISTTPHLLWASAGQQPGKQAIILFESDGAVVAEYHISAPGNLMAFDAGNYQLQQPAAIPESTPTPAPSPTPIPVPSAPSDAPSEAPAEAPKEPVLETPAESPSQTPETPSEDA